MLYRIEMDVIKVIGEIIIIANDVVVVTFLPELRPRQRFLPALKNDLSLQAGNDLGNIALRNREYPVEMVVEDDMTSISKSLALGNQGQSAKQSALFRSTPQPWQTIAGDNRQKYALR